MAVPLSNGLLEVINSLSQPYIALLHCWGKDNETLQVKVGNAVVKVSENIEHALHAVN